MKTPTLLMVGIGLLVAALEGGALVDTERTFRAKCASCHGADGKGDTAQGKKVKIGDMTRKDWHKQFADGQMKVAINEGFKREKDGVTQEMKSFKDRLK